MSHRSPSLQPAFGASRAPLSWHGDPSGTRQTARHLGDDDLVEAEDEGGSAFRIRVARDGGSRRRAHTLMARRYAWRGYSTGPLELHPASRVTLSAHAQGSTLGTITAAADGVHGLFVEHLYPEVDALRTEGRRLCEFTRLAVDEGVGSHAVLGALFHAAVLYVVDVHGCTDALIEVNPRHVRFYERMVGFEQCGELRQDPHVDAPAVLLQLDLAHCIRESRRLGGLRSAAGSVRSFYPYFFAQAQAREASSRLLAR